MSNGLKEIVEAVNLYCTFDRHLDLRTLDSTTFVALQEALIASAKCETLIAFARDNAVRADIARIERACWERWVISETKEAQTDRAIGQRMFEKVRLGALVPGVDVERLEDDVVKSAYVGHLIRFADEVPGANVERIENVLFAKHPRPCDLAEFAAVRGANVARIEGTVLASGDLLAMLDLLTGSFNLGYRSVLGVNAKAVLDAIRLGIKTNTLASIHPLDLICCYEKAKALAERYGEKPIVSLENVQNALCTDKDRAEDQKRMLAQMRALIHEQPKMLQ